MPQPTLRRAPPRPRFDHGAPISAIDTRPMVFVALIMAVVFLLAASQTRTHVLLVDLPFQPPELSPHSGPFMPVHRIRMTDEGTVLFDGQPVSTMQLAVLLEETKAAPRHSAIAFEPDGNVPYGVAASTLAVVARAGLIDRFFCIDGLEKHQQFAKRGSAFPILLSIRLDPKTGAQSMLPPLAFESCNPERLVAPTD